jgi:hypothetical protein
MSRLRRYLIPTLLLLPLIFVCGKLLLTPVWRQATIIEQDLAHSSFSDMWESGWPLVFLQLSTWTSDTVTVYHISYWSLLADVAILLAAIVTFGWVIHWHHRRRGAWLRVSLAELMVLVAAFGVATGWWTREYFRWHRQQHAIAELATKPGLSTDTNYCGPQWLRRLWSEDDLTIFQRPTFVVVASSAPDDSIGALPALVRDLPDVRSLYVQGDWKGGVPVNSHFRLTEPAAFRNIEEVCFSRVNVDDAALADLPALPRLRVLEVYGDLTAGSPDRGLGHVGKCDALEELRIADRTITDDELAQLARLTRLRFLSVSTTQLTDTAIDTLIKLKSLEHLSFSDSSNVTEPAVYRLLLQLPSIRTFGTAVVLGPQTIQLLRDRNISGY